MSNQNQQPQKFDLEACHIHYQDQKQVETSQAVILQHDKSEFNDPTATSRDILSWFWLNHGQLSNFNCGVFWGFIFSFTAIVSGLLGAGLTTISSVRSNFIAKLNYSKITSLSSDQDKKISHISPSSNTSKLTKKSEQTDINHRFTRQVNLLLIGIEPHSELKENSPTAFMGDSRTILLLQFQPQENLVTVVDIPPDSRVPIPGLGWGTIRDAHKYGGTSLVSQVASQLFDNISIDGYIRATPTALSALSSGSGKLKFDCLQGFYTPDKARSYPTQSLNSAQNCSATSKQIKQQQIWWETIRQRLQEPRISDRLPRIIFEVNQYLDTNFSSEEILVLANFIGKLESDRLQVSLLPDYRKNQVTSNVKSMFSQLSITNSKSTQKTAKTVHPWQNVDIAVQNTTDNPDLSLKVISYLNQKGFNRVHLIEHLPLKLARTEILLTQSKIQAADYLKQVLGIGRLELDNHKNGEKKLTIRIGEDARYLNLENSFIR